MNNRNLKPTDNKMPNTIKEIIPRRDDLLIPPSRILPNTTTNLKVPLLGESSYPL